MTEPTNWLEYGEPVGTDRVEATMRKPRGSSPDEDTDGIVIQGTLPKSALDVWEEYDEQVTQDGNLNVSAIPDESLEELKSAFETGAFGEG